MEVIPLQSGSSGNCIYVQCGDVRLLFDAGISGRQVELRLQQFGIEIREVTALVISHDHHDHTRSIGVLNRKYGLPIHITKPTLRAIKRTPKHGNLNRIRFFESGERFQIDGVTIETIKTPHDAVDGVGFVVDDGHRRLGVLTDLGSPFGRLREILPTLDAVVLESNYDPEMLIHSRYPDVLKSRIAGIGGHLSNFDAAELLCLASRDLQWAILAHLSEENNDPEKAIQTHRRVLPSKLILKCADRYQASERMRVEKPKQRKSPPARFIQPSLFAENA